MSLLTSTSKHFTGAPLHLARLHERADKNSTKLGSNLYGRIENKTDTHADAVYKYYDTDIIRALYEYGDNPYYDDQPEVKIESLNLLAFEIFTDGWESSTYTTRRIRQFLNNNHTGYSSFGFDGTFYVMKTYQAHQFWREDAARAYRETGVTRKERWKPHNQFVQETHSAFVVVNTPVIHPFDKD